jgi:carbonic anhydrase
MLTITSRAFARPLLCAAWLAATGVSALANEEPAKPPVREATPDKLESLRQRLADKLGSARESAPDGALVLRVPAREPVVASAGRSPKPRSKPPMLIEEAALQPHVHWDYDGEGGPQAWAQLKPEYATCGTGRRQSPIDIRDGIRVELDPVVFDYRPSAFSVIDNGHTVQVNLPPGNTIQVLGRRYELLQFHFHRPSENRVNGKLFDMEAHLVHKDPEGRLAVVAVLLERGAAQTVIQTVWNNLPLEKGEELPAAHATLDLNRLLPEDRSYFTYMGSLTTPPCTEGVLWMVMRKPVTVATEQIQVFSRLYVMNARRVQPAAGRLIKESN